ncbi:MAG: sterol desaturase family protein [Sinimarinibacterium flocculans]|uniref:sterol desaturase family protein n=1 Tax=Sinimarinibacterium flocculans TaxID=985250 RepID=UPI003C55CF8F
MTTHFWIALAAIFGVLGALQVALDWAVVSRRFGKYRVRTPGPDYLGPQNKWLNVSLNNVLALSILGGFLLRFGPDVLYPQWPGAAHLLGEVLAVLLLYDFGYYLYHRGMHHPKVMKYVHGVHHKVRFPVASESVFLNPLEQMGAFALLLGAVLLLGPISEASFLLMFFLYSAINIIVHSNLVFPHPAFRLFNFWVEKHDAHHDKFRYNYASIFPFWDQAFGTFK